MEYQVNHKLTYYSPKHIKEFITSLGGKDIELTDQQEIELKRLGHNKSFKHKHEGIFECISFKI